MSTLAIISFNLILSGAILLIIGLLLHRRKTDFYKLAVRTEGTVSGLIKTEIDDSSSEIKQVKEILTEASELSRGFYYSPQIEYSLPSGENYQIEGLASYPPKYNIGNKVILFYDETKPERAVIDSFTEKWLTVMIIFMLGVVCLTAGIIFQLL